MPEVTKNASSLTGTASQKNLNQSFEKGTDLSSWIIQGNLTLTSAGKTQLNFRGALVQIAAKPPLVRDFISSKVSTTASCQPQTVTTKRFCSSLSCHQPHICGLLDQGSARLALTFLLTHEFSAGAGSQCGRRVWVLGHPKESPVPAPAGIPECLEVSQLGNLGLSLRTCWKGSPLSSKFHRVRLFLTSKFFRVTQEEEFTWALQVEEGEPAESRLIPKQQRSSHANLHRAHELGGMHVIKEEWQRWGQSRQQRKTKFFQCF